ARSRLCLSAPGLMGPVRPRANGACPPPGQGACPPPGERAGSAPGRTARPPAGRACACAGRAPSKSLGTMFDGHGRLPYGPGVETIPTSFAPVPQLVEELAAGRMIVLVDDEDRENEGDFVVAAEHLTVEHVVAM